MSEFSQSRLESRIMEAISSMIVSGQIKNPHLSVFTSVTRVELAPDNTAARIYVSSMPEERIDPSVRALNSAKGFIQRKLADVLRTKNTPVLEFFRDDSYREADRVNKLIDEAMKETSGR